MHNRPLRTRKSMLAAAASAIALTLVLTTPAMTAQKQQSAARKPAPTLRPALQPAPKAAAPAKRSAQPAPLSSARKATPEIVRPAGKTNPGQVQSKSAAPAAPSKAAPEPSQSTAKSPVPPPPKTAAPAGGQQNNSTADKSAHDSAIAAAKAAAGGGAAPKATTLPSAAFDSVKDAAVDAVKAAANSAASKAVGAKEAAGTTVKNPLDASTLKQNIDISNSGLKTGASDGAMTGAGKNIQQHNQGGNNGTSYGGLKTGSPDGPMKAAGNDTQQNKQAGNEADKNATATVNADGTVIDTSGGVANKQSPFTGLERGKFSSARDAGGFGTDRANAHAGSGGPMVNAKGHAKEGDAPKDDTGTLADMLKTEGGKASGDVQKDLNELAYAQSVGSDGYAATKNMSQAERQSYWDKETQKQLNGAGRPREDDAGGAVKPIGSPTVDRQVLHQAGQSIGAKGGSAGGGNDPRTDNSQGQGGGTATVMKGTDDGTVKTKVDQSGTLSVEKALQINQTTNPVRTGAQK